MSRNLKAVLIVAGAAVAALVMAVVALVLATVFRSAGGGAESSVELSLLGLGAGLLASVGAVYVGLGRTGIARGWQLVVSAVFAVGAGILGLVMAVASAVAFDK